MVVYFGAAHHLKTVSLINHDKFGLQHTGMMGLLEGYLDKPVNSSSDGNIETVDIGLDFVLSEQEDVPNFALHQNAPNPFSKYSNIGFNLPNEMSAKIILYDLTGKIVQEISGDYHQGYNTVQVEKKDFKSSGIFYYTLQAGQYSATKKLIVLE